MNEQKLERCPFCGESPRMKEDKNSCGELFYQVRHDCKHLLSMIKTFCYTTEAEAAEAWNRRAPQPDNCANNDCPYQCGEPCPARDGCGGFTPDNKALTVEELREMDGEPVRVEEDGEYQYGLVSLSGCALAPQGEVITLCSGDFYLLSEMAGNYEVYSIAFRRPPEKGE